MPTSSFPITGKIYDRDGSTVINGVTVIVFDVTLGQKTSVTTNVLGEFIADLSNLASAWTEGDKLQITAFYGDGSARRSLSKRYTVKTSDGSYDIGNMILHAGEEPFGKATITYAHHTATANANVDFYDRNDNFVFNIRVLANSFAVAPIGYLGKIMDGGFIRVFGTETAGTSEVLTVWK